MLTCSSKRGAPHNARFQMISVVNVKGLMGTTFAFFSLNVFQKVQYLVYSQNMKGT